MSLLLVIVLVAVAPAVLCGEMPRRYDASLKYATFRTPAVALKSGQIANTDTYWPGDGKTLPFVEGPVAVRHFHARVVDDDNKTVPLTEVYVHHWLLFRGSHNGGMCPNLDNIWGIGAELLGTEYNYPAPYALVTTGNESWTANLHFIRTTNVKDIQSCIECRCPQSNPPLHPFGGIDCCPDRAQCWGMENWQKNDTKNYYLEYTVGYTEVDASVKHLEVFSFDATASQTVDCNIEYQVPALKDGETHTLRNRAKIEVNMSVVFVEVHQHIGGVQMTVDHMRNGNKLGTMCYAEPKYGTGDEEGYVVAIPTCEMADAWELLEGDELEFTSVYNNRGLPGGDPWHAGVMALVYLAAEAKDPTKVKCLDQFYHDCGEAPYESTQWCLQCYQQHLNVDLQDCTKAIIDHQCSKSLDNGNIPAPDTVTNMTLHIKPTDTAALINFTGPASAWFAVARNPSNPPQPVMSNSTAFVYTVNSKGQPVVQLRTLGDHSSGTVINANYPATITQLPGGIAHVSLSLPLKSSNSQADSPSHYPGCYLFAKGESLNFGYHGANRGYTCVWW